MTTPQLVPVPHPFPLEEILTPNEVSTLSDDIKGKLNQSIHELKDSLHNIRTQFQAEKVVYGQHTYDLDNRLTTTTSNLSSLQAALASSNESTVLLQSKHDALSALVSKLQSDNTHLTSTLQTTEAKLAQLDQTNDELLKLVEKRNVEIGRLSDDAEKLGTQLETASCAKIEAMQKVDELVSREIEVKYREKHMLTQQAYQSDQLKLLNEELERKSFDLLNAQRDSSVKYIHLQTDLSEKIEQLKIAEMKLADLKELYDKSEKQVENLMEKLRGEGELRGKVEENYRVEVGSLKRVVELYKESTDDSSKKLEELEDAVQNLQDLLKESTEKYGQLETRFAESSRQLQEEISKRDELIGKMKQELKTANEVLESIQKHGMTDEMIHSLSPAAAAASQMLKESKSITEIFSKYQEVQVELGRVKCDNLKLNGYIREILEDIETRAPTLQKQKEEYERAVQTVEILSSQMDVTMRENSNCKTEIVQLKKNLGAAERENTRLKGQIEDMARQVRCLLGEQEREQDQPSSSQTVVDGGHVITNTLSTFRNIAELQSQNLRLLTVVRELTTQREQSEKLAEENSLAEIKSSFSGALAELQELKNIRLRQDEKIKEIQQQRDTLTNMLKQRDMTTNNTSDLTLGKLNQTEKDLQKLKEEFNVYKVEKRENEKILNETSEKLREEVLRVRSENGRLAGQIEYNNERTKIYNKNLEGYKKEIGVLEERCRGLQGVVAKHEGSIEVLKSELHTTHSSLSRAEVSITTLTNERNLLRENKNRLQLEKDMLQRHEKMSNLLQTNLEEIKNNLEMSNSSIRIKLENEVESLKNENTILKRRIESESERNKDLLKNSEVKLEQLREKLRNEEECKSKLTDEASELKIRIDQLSKELETTKNSLETETSVTDHMMEPPENQNLELITLKSELESLRNQLELSKSNTEEYRNLSSVMESQLTLANDTNSAINSEFQIKVAEKESTIFTLQVELENLSKEFENYKEEAVKKISQISARTNELENELRKALEDYESARVNLLKSEQELERVREDLANEGRIKEELRNGLDREVMSRGEETKEFNRIKAILAGLEEQVESEKKLKERSEEMLTLKHLEYSTKESDYQKEITSLKEQVKEYSDACEKLELQLTSVLSQQGTSVEFPSSSDSKCSEQWLQLIRFLRREKEIAMSKMESALAQSERLESQFAALRDQYEEVKLELGRVSGGESAAGLLTSVKQAELLRKVETLSALSDSNRLLREENTTLQSTLTNLSTQLSTLTSSQISPLELQVSQLTQENDQLTLQNQSLKESSIRWQKRANELIEKTNKVNPEEMKRLQGENEVFAKKCVDLEGEMKRFQSEAGKFEKQFKIGQGNIVGLRGEVQRMEAELRRVEGELRGVKEDKEKLGGEEDKLKVEMKKVTEDKERFERENDRLKGELGRVEGSLEEHKSTVKQVKNIARKYKKQYEDLLQEQQPLATTEALTAEIAELKEQLDSIQMERTQSEENKEKVANELRTELETANNEKSRLEGEVVEEQGRLRELSTTLVTTQSTLTTTSTLLATVQSENTNLKAELDMLRQRLALIEKIHQQKSSNEPLEENKCGGSIQVVRPIMTAPKEQKLVVNVRPQENVVQPMVHQQPSSQLSSVVSQSQPGRMLQQESQAQVSSSGSDFYNQQGQQRVVSIQPRVQVEEQVEEEESVDQEVVPGYSGEVSSSLTTMGNAGGSGEASSSTSNKRGRECDEGSSSSSAVVKRGKFQEHNEVDQQIDDEEEEEDEEQEDEEEEEDEEEMRQDDDSREREAESATATTRVLNPSSSSTNLDQDQVVAVEEEEEDQEVEVEESGHQEDLIDEEEELHHEQHPISSSSGSGLQPPNTTSQQQLRLDHSDISIVPSTPTLFRPQSSRNEGFSELLTTSTTTTRFTFSSLGEDEQYGSGSGGRSVPSTPAEMRVEDMDDEEQDPEVVVLEDDEDEEHVDEEEEEEEEGEEGEVEDQEDEHRDDDDEDDVLVPASTSSTTTTYSPSPAEVPSSSTTPAAQESTQKTRPTPIVWDQPTSSSHAQSTLPTGHAHAAPPFRGAPRMLRGVGPQRFSYRSSVSSTFRPQLQQRGVMRQRGPMQSARRSRPPGVSGLGVVPRFPPGSGGGI